MEAGFVDAISKIIGTYGFPIAMCLLMFYDSRQQRDKDREKTDKLTEAVNALTLYIKGGKD